MMEITCTKGQTWDVLALNHLGDEFRMDELLSENQYFHSDILTFENGDKISIPERVIEEISIIKSPWG